MWLKGHFFLSGVEYLELFINEFGFFPLKFYLMCQIKGIWSLKSDDKLHAAEFTYLINLIFFIII